MYKPVDSLHLNCNDEISNTIVLRSTKNQNRKIYFQLQARSGVIISGHYSTETSETILNDKNNNTFDLKFKLIKSTQEFLPERKYQKESQKIRAKYCSEELTFTNEELVNDVASNDEMPERRIYINPWSRITLTKWYYDTKSDSCKKLSKKSVQKTTNQFDTKQSCEEECKISPCKF